MYNSDLYLFFEMKDGGTVMVPSSNIAFMTFAEGNVGYIFLKAGGSNLAVIANPEMVEQML